VIFQKIKRMFEQRRQREDLYSTAGYWDSKACQLEGNAVSMWPNNALNELYHREQTALILEALPSVNSKDLIDLGCGTGRLSRWFAARGASVIGVDFSKEALRIAKHNTVGENPRYRHLSMFDISDEAKFDILVSWGSITIATKNSTELKGLMAALHRALRPGGDALLLEPIHHGFLHRVLDMNVKEFTQIMKTEGFDIQFIKPLHFWPMRLLLCYFPLPRMVTMPLYSLGQAIMKIPFFNTMGDYYAIYAVRRKHGKCELNKQED